MTGEAMRGNTAELAMADEVPGVKSRDGNITRRDLVEGKIEKLPPERGALVQLSDAMGGLVFRNALELARARISRAATRRTVGHQLKRLSPPR